MIPSFYTLYFMAKKRKKKIAMCFVAKYDTHLFPMAEKFEEC